MSGSGTITPGNRAWRRRPAITRISRASRRKSNSLGTVSRISPNTCAVMGPHAIQAAMETFTQPHKQLHPAKTREEPQIIFLDKKHPGLNGDLYPGNAECKWAAGRDPCGALKAHVTV